MSKKVIYSHTDIFLYTKNDVYKVQFSNRGKEGVTAKVFHSEGKCLATKIFANKRAGISAAKLAIQEFVK